MHLSRLQFSKGVTFAEILLDLSSERIGALGVGFSLKLHG
jgi:hypothetical protein